MKGFSFRAIAKAFSALCSLLFTSKASRDFKRLKDFITN